MACLTSLGIGALDGEEPTGEIDGFPSEFQEFTSPKSRVYGKENRERYVVPEVRERRKDFAAALVSPDIGGLAGHPHLCIAHLQGLAKPEFLAIVEKANIGSSVESRLIHSPNRVFGE